MRTPFTLQQGPATDDPEDNGRLASDAPPVFLCHASEDAAIAADLANELEKPYPIPS